MEFILQGDGKRFGFPEAEQLGREVIAQVARDVLSWKTSENIESDMTNFKLWDTTYSVPTEIFSQLTQPAISGTSHMWTRHFMKSLLRLKNYSASSNESKFAFRILVKYPNIFYNLQLELSTTLLGINPLYYSDIVSTLDRSGILWNILQINNREALWVLSVLLKIPTSKKIGEKHALALYRGNKLDLEDMVGLGLSQEWLLTTSITAENTQKKVGLTFFQKAGGILTRPITLWGSVLPPKTVPSPSISILSPRV